MCKNYSQTMELMSVRIMQDPYLVFKQLLIPTEKYTPTAGWLLLGSYYSLSKQFGWKGELPGDYHSDMDCEYY